MSERNWKGDLLGGVISSIMGLPKAIPWGVLVFAPLGPASLAIGTFASLVSLVFSNIGSAASRGSPILNSGPFSITTIMLASAVPIILSHTNANLTDPATLTLVLEFVFFTVFLSGVFQIIFGFAKIGTLAKYIPYPVIAGLMNGAGIAIIFSQIPTLIGLGKETQLNHFSNLFHNISLPTLCVGGFTLLLFGYGDKLSRWMPLSFLAGASSTSDVNRRKAPRIPPAFFGLIGGTVIYYLFAAWGYDKEIGDTIGTITGGIPTPEHFLNFVGIVFQGEQMSLLLELAAIAMSMAIVNSLRSLIVVMAIDNVTFERSNSNKELIGQGIGNMLSATFGGISSAVSQSTTIAGYRNGARTASTKIYSGLFSLLILILLTPIISLLPKLVLAASLVMMGIEALDSWSIKLLRNALIQKEKSKEYVDILVVLMVTGISVFYGTTDALAIGILLSVVNFIYRMGKDILVRDYDASKIRSNIIRPVEEIEFFEREGDKIRILELQGALFFGTADKLASNIEAILNQKPGRIRYIILNFRKVNEIDGSGGNILGQIRKRCQKQGIEVWLCSSGFPEMEQRLKAFGIQDLIKGNDFYTEIDAAVGCAEDKLLDEKYGVARHKIEKKLSEVSVLSSFSQDEMQTFSGYLKHSHFKNADFVYKQNDAGDRLFFILKGRAKVELLADGSTTPFIISILCPGMMFGEMAIIDGSPRSAGIVAEGELSCVSISNAEISKMLIAHPEIAQKLYHGLTLTLLQRLRTSDKAISKLRD